MGGFARRSMLNEIKEEEDDVFVSVEALNDLLPKPALQFDGFRLRFDKLIILPETGRQI